MARGGTRIAQPTKLSLFRYNNNNQRVPDVDGVVVSVYGVVSHWRPGTSLLHSPHYSELSHQAS